MTTAVNLETLRVLCIERSDERTRVLMQALATAGHCIVGRSRSVQALNEDVWRLQPDVVIVDAESADEALFARIGGMNQHVPRPVILFTDDDDHVKIGLAIRCGVTCYVVDGFALERIEPIVRVAKARFEHDQAIRAERDDAQARLAERKLIERAKGILMRKRGIGEDEAYHALRRNAMERNMRMSELAERLISMSDLLG
jgi:response regulator NasT